ncbi:MAG: YcjX family protein [Beijerinckiaceae bacterium]
MTFLSGLADETRIAARSLYDYVAGTGLRLGVTGLSRSGKTVFITALIHNLLRLSKLSAAEPGRVFPVFRVHAENRLTRSFLEPQPDYNVARFDYENHLAALTGGAQGPGARHWPQSTNRISELRITLEFERKTGWRRGADSLTLDIIDYPGEWLLDLPLLAKTYAEWSAETLGAAESPARAHFARDWRSFVASLDPAAPYDEAAAQTAAALFTAYLRAARDDRYALSTLPPGRFLLPGELEGSPILTFTPLPQAEGGGKSGSLAAEMEQRFEKYKHHVVQPFFRDHFSRLDRQIVLVDALSALNSGPAAVRDLETAMAGVMTAFRTGQPSWLTSIFRPRIDRILFAATKADRLHHTSHDRLEEILRLLVGRAIARAENLGAQVDVLAMAAVRATREVTVKDRGETLDAISGFPEAGETVHGETFDGNSEAAIFPGELPADPKAVFQGEGIATPDSEAPYRFVRFRPPLPGPMQDGHFAPLPHIRLDRALEYLLGDRLV